MLRAAETLMARDGFHQTSMHAVADEAGVSVGLIYQYFAGKDDLLLSVLTSVLEQFGRDLPETIAAHADPVEQLAAGFRVYCRVIDAHRSAAVLAYREAGTLDHHGREIVKQREIETTAPLVEAVVEGRRRGIFREDCVPALVGHELIVLAQAWALKHWYFGKLVTLDRYVEHQLALVLGGLVEPARQDAYRHLLTPGAGGREDIAGV